MKKRLLAFGCMACLCFVFCGALSAQDIANTVTSIEKSLWEAWKNKQTEPFEQNLTDDSVNVGAMGVTTGKDALIKEMASMPCDVREFSFSDWQIHKINSDTVMVTYKAKQDATCGGNKVPTEVVASSIYVKQGDKWLAASHQETPVMDMHTMKTE